MKSFAYLSVLLVPLVMGLGILGYLVTQIIRDRKNEQKGPGRIGGVIFAVVFWVLFAAFYLWRTWPTTP